MSFCINPNCSNNSKNSDTDLFCRSCNTELLLEGRYRVKRPLGSGGFCRTYEVQDYDGSLKVLKVLTRDTDKSVELFQREAQVLSQLNHPGIPRVESDAYFMINFGRNQEPLHCLVMEKIEGLDLYQYIRKKRGVISEKRAIQWLLQLTVILREVHKRNFFHRDIKPSNIMLRANGQLVLIDFGTAREMTSTYISKQSVGDLTGIVSAGYTPFEQMNGQSVPQSDFFALGRTFVFLLTGKHPSQMYDPQNDQLKWQEAAPHISPEFANFLNYLMERLPKNRPQNAQKVWEELQEVYRKISHSSSSSQGITKLPTEEETENILPLPKPSPQEANTPTIPLKSNPLKTPTSSEPTSKLNPSFVERCQKELAEFIGPMASIICKRTLNQNPNFSTRDFVEALASKIPDAEQALIFKKRLLF